MSIALIVIPSVILVFVLYFFNRLRTLQVQIKASIQEIGNQLKRQANLIPNLVKSVKGYMKHEKAIFNQLTSARKIIQEASRSHNAQKIDQSQELISKALGSLRVLVESNPQIKASSLVANLSNELRDTADKVMYARRTLIDLTADYNTAVQTIPGIWLAPILGFKPQKGLATPADGSHLQVSSSETKTPSVDLD